MKARGLTNDELAEMEASFTKWINMPGIGHEPYGAFIAGYMAGRMSELPQPDPTRAE